MPRLMLLPRQSTSRLRYTKDCIKSNGFVKRLNCWTIQIWLNCEHLRASPAVESRRCTSWLTTNALYSSDFNQMRVVHAWSVSSRWINNVQRTEWPSYIIPSLTSWNALCHTRYQSSVLLVYMVTCQIGHHDETCALCILWRFIALKGNQRHGIFISPHTNTSVLWA